MAMRLNMSPGITVLPQTSSRLPQTAPPAAHQQVALQSSCWSDQQTSVDLTDHGDRDGSGWNVPEIRCVALQTDPQRVSPSRITDRRKKGTNLTNPRAKKPRVRDV
ncbi:unnamed protein product [Pleuronectes platessa]|uniref:Uncharacterized protein n=1 Tax=Pleuronectes platessa TaxID=8262 RepID=A0A9N7VY64_PLEPL|nr:unnamed protein product [Pleuronectes platessa]